MKTVNQLLKREDLPDNNKLNKEFYNELLHILGLTETISDGKIKIERKDNNRNEGSLLELIIAQLENCDLSLIYVETRRAKSQQAASQPAASQIFDMAFSLLITWINRILFLKLLEARLLKYHDDDTGYAFLTTDKINVYNNLNKLFFQIMALAADKRPAYLQEFSYIPFLNCTLFEETELEKVLKIGALPKDIPLPLYKKTVLRLPSYGGVRVEFDALEYLLHFLNAYNFSGIQYAGKNSTKLISTAALGLILEKINGYREGSFFTPSFITMYMCRETIGKAVIRKFNEAKGWSCQTITDVHNHIGGNTKDIQEANRIFNSLRICDPAVGSGHFLVSALNEMIYLKSELGILTDESGKTLNICQIEIVSDELVIKHNGDHFRYRPQDAESRHIQQTLFHAKQTIIKNCLFGVDINPNSVKICQLRLWIELLKNAYYTVETGRAASLQTLPNIDNNIKCGNSLLNGFDWRFEFTELMDDKGCFTGFDVVIGNPPYISASTMVEMYPQMRKEIVDSNQYTTLFQKWDLYVPFIELGLQLLADGGILAMIVPYPITNQTYAKKIRELIINQYNLINIVDLLGTKVFDMTTVSNCIPMIVKSKSGDSCYISQIDENNQIKRQFEQLYSDLVIDKKNAVWNLTAQKRKTSRYAKMNILGDFCFISKGMVLNANIKKEKNKFVKDDLISETYDAIHCRKYIETKDIDRYVVKKTHYLEYNTERCPNKICRPTFKELYERPKLMFNRMGNLVVYYDKNTHFLHSESMFSGVLWKDLKGINNCSINVRVKRYKKYSRKAMESLSEQVDLCYLLGILNSKYAGELLSIQRGGDYHIYPEHLRNFPVPLVTKDRQQPIITLVNQILSAKNENPAADTSDLEKEIDMLVYELYSVTKDDNK